MIKYLILVKLNLMNMFNFNKFKKLSLAKKISISFLTIYIAASIVVSVLIYTKYLYSYLNKIHLAFIIPSILVFVVAFASLSMSLFNSKNLLFDSKDDDVILPLPVSKYQVFLSRFTTLYLLNLTASFILLSIAGGYYGYISNQPPSYYLYLINVIIMTPVIPTVLITVFGYIVAMVASKLKQKNIVEIITSFLLVFGLMLTIINGKYIFDILIANQELVLKIVKYGFYPIYLLYFVFVENDLSKLVHFNVINLIILFTFTYLMSIRYYQILSSLKSSSIKSIFKGFKEKKLTPLKALVIKEFKRYVSSPIYVLNTSFSVILLFIAAIATYFYSFNDIVSVLDLEGTNLSIELMVLSMVLFVTALSSTTNSSISLEGSSLWIMKSLPVKPSVIYSSKLIVNYLVVIPLTIISIIILGINLKLGIFNIFIFSIIGSLMAIAISHFGLYTNLMFPMFNYNSDVQVVKQSASSMISILVPLVIVGAVITIVNIKAISIINFEIGIIITLLLVIAILRVLIFRNNQKRFLNLA